MAIKFKSDYDSRYRSPDVSEVTVNGVPLGKRAENKEFSPLSIFLWLSAIVAAVMTIHALAPVAAMFVALAVLCVVLLVVFIPTLFTLGLIWTSDGYREFVANVYGLFLLLEQDGVVQQALDFLSTTFWYVMSIGGVIILISLLWSIFDFKCEPTINLVKKRRMTKIIGCSIVFLIATIFAGIFLAVA